MSERERVPYYVVDAFTDRPFSGNPAAVLVLERPLPAAALQAIAREMNLSETAFPGTPGPDGRRTLRWFTPRAEVPLCGHATLAASHVLLSRGASAPLRFSTASGDLTVHREADGGLRMDFPADPPVEAPAPPGLLEALEVERPMTVLRAANLWLVRVATPGEVAGLEPDQGALARVDPGPGALGVTVTAAGDGRGGGPDFVSRFFAPWVGVDEDPVTGVAHTVLGPFWAEALGRSRLTARQVSDRPGDVGVEVVGDRVHLTGRAVTVAEGVIVLPAPLEDPAPAELGAAAPGTRAPVTGAATGSSGSQA